MNKYKIVLLLAIFTVSCAFVIYKPKYKPTIFLIGDSTMRNGSLGNGGGGQWGWGSFIHNLFDTTKISIENHAMGGTSSKSFVDGGLWDKTLVNIRPGDFVIMQFGHNDNGANTIKGNGEDTIQRKDPRTGQLEVIHSFGWNMRKYIRETREKGATPIVCSLVPRNRWTNGKVNRDDHSHGEWAKQAAAQEGALFVDLNTIISDYYDQQGQEKVMSTYFAADPVHTILAGAKVSATLVVEGIKGLKHDPLKKYILKHPADIADWKFAPSKDYRK